MLTCNKHPEEQAVAQCEICGDSICEECRKKTNAFAKMYGVLCPDCCKMQLNKEVDFYTQRKKSRITRLITVAILFVVGVVLLAICGPVGDGGIVTAILAILALICCSIGPIIWVKNKHKEAHDAWEEEHGTKYNVSTTMTGDVKVERDKGDVSLGILVILCLAFGLILSPVSMVILLIGIVSDTKEVKLLKSCVDSM